MDLTHVNTVRMGLDRHKNNTTYGQRHGDLTFCLFMLYITLISHHENRSHLVRFFHKALIFVTSHAASR